MSASEAPDALADGSDGDKFLFLAAMPPAQYDRIRESIAAGMGIRVGTLDTEVSKLRRPFNKPKALALSDPEPWAEPVAGSELLDSIEQLIATHVVTTEANRTAIALWILMTYAVESLFILPVLLITSPQKRCGKSTLLILLNKLCRKPLLVSNASTAPIFRVIEKSRPTLLFDEVDTWLRKDDDQSLRGLINAGHTRETAQVLRCVGDQFEPQTFDCFCPKAISGINSGAISDTMTDRSIVIELARRGPNEPVSRLRQDRLNLDHLRSLARRWADDHLSAILDADPTVPAELNDRAADNWRSLLTLADLCGALWSERARKAAKTLSGTDYDDDDIRCQLLADIRYIFTERRENQIASADLVQMLAGLEARPWGEWKHGKAISAVQLARLLRPFRISTFNVRDGSRVYKAYSRVSFDDAFRRYLKDEVAPATSLPELDSQSDRTDSSATRHPQVAARSATVTYGVAGQNGANGAENWGSSGVAAQEQETEVLEI